MTFKTLVCAATVLGLASLPTFGASSEQPDSQQFVKKATQSNLAEIKVSQLALDKTQNGAVRDFAQKMIADHQKANAEMAPIAQAKNLKVPDDTDAMHKASLKMLQAKSGPSFDSAYIDQMNKDHEKTIALFKAAQSSGKVDPDLKSLASKTLPVLEQHHDMVSKPEMQKSASR